MEVLTRVILNHHFKINYSILDYSIVRDKDTYCLYMHSKIADYKKQNYLLNKN